MDRTILGKSFLFVVVVVAALSAAGCSSADPQGDAQAFLDTYSARYQELYYASAKAEWDSNTHIVEGDDTNAKRTRAANEALAAFTGSQENIDACKKLLDSRASLTDPQVRQLERILYLAADTPQTIPDVVKERIAAETAQTEKLYGFTYKIDGKEVTTNDIDGILRESDNLDERLAAWNASKEVGPTLRDGLENLRRLRNASVRPLGYSDYYSYQVSEYGMSDQEMLDMMDRLISELRPLYRELHTYFRYELAKKYRKPVPDLIPAHWLPNRWGQDWQDLVSVEGFNLDDALAKKDAEWIVKQGERFYVSLGFDPLPESFWELSSLYPVPPGADYKKNNHASAWHMDLAQDIRSLMSVEPNTSWYETAHHELGHIYYYQSYTNPDVPLLLRRGANRAFHEAVGSMMGLASLQPRFVEAIGLLQSDAKPDPIKTLFKEALNYVVFIPFSAGTMSRFEHQLYAEELPADQWNQRWWELVGRYQGIAPPEARGEDYCDAATKTHINDDAAQYYDYALSNALLFQMHGHIAREILHENPRDTNYFGRKDVGDFLKSILSPGSSVDWRELLRDKLGSDLNGQATLDYFAPLMEWLREQNKGREATLPDLG